MNTLLLVIIFVLGFAAHAFWILRAIKNIPKPNMQDLNISVDTSRLTEQMHKHNLSMSDNMRALPSEVMNTIIGTTNVHKGRLGELIGYVSLKAEYDRIIPLGNIVDFMGICFDKPGVPGYVDFIDIKTGETARLNKDQRALKSLLVNKQVNFKTIKIDTINGLSDNGNISDQTLERLSEVPQPL